MMAASPENLSLHSPPPGLPSSSPSSSFSSYRVEGYKNELLLLALDLGKRFGGGGGGGGGEKGKIEEEEKNVIKLFLWVF